MHPSFACAGVSSGTILGEAIESVNDGMMKVFGNVGSYRANKGKLL